VNSVPNADSFSHENAQWQGGRDVLDSHFTYFEKY